MELFKTEPIVPPLSVRARVWLVATPIILMQGQLLFALSDFDLPWSWTTNMVVEELFWLILGLAWLHWGVKVDRRSFGLTIGDGGKTLTRTGIQLLIQGVLAALYTIAVIVVARTTPLRIPVRPTSLTDFDHVGGFVLMAVVAGPLYEEILFRGMLLSGLDWPGKRWLSVIGSACLFTLPHFSLHGRIVPMAGALVMGLVLGWSYLRTRSVLTSFAVHAACNIGVIVKDLLMQYHPDLVRRILGYS